MLQKCGHTNLGPFHFAFNMFALYSFAPPLVDIMGKEHFLATYLTGAVISSYASYVYRVSLRDLHTWKSLFVENFEIENKKRYQKVQSVSFKHIGKLH